MREPVEVVFIAGCGRSGSTLIDNLLGQVDGVFAAGEIWHIWRRGLLENRLCSDGRVFREHPFWRAVAAEAFGGMRDMWPEPASRLASAARSLLVSARYPLLATGRMPDLHGGLSEYREALSRLYSAIAAVSGARLLVDSSKSPVYAACLSTLPGVRVRVLHVVRDPRAVAYSWSRYRVQPDKGSTMDRHGTLWSALHWRLANAAARALPRVCATPYRLLRYEDFVRAPRTQLQALLQWLGDADATLPLEGEDGYVVRPGCAFSGNPSRFRAGLQKLHPDEEWRKALRVDRRLLVQALAGAEMRRYGYCAAPEPPA